MFARRPTGRLAESTLDGGTPLAWPFYNTAQAACRGLRRRVKPICNLCDSRWADATTAIAPRVRGNLTWKAQVDGACNRICIGHRCFGDRQFDRIVGDRIASARDFV